MQSSSNQHEHFELSCSTLQGQNSEGGGNACDISHPLRTLEKTQNMITHIIKDTSCSMRFYVCIIVVKGTAGQFCPPFAPPTSPPTFPSPPPPSTPNICFLVLTCLAHLFFLTLHPHTAQSTSS